MHFLFELHLRRVGGSVACIYFFARQDFQETGGSGRRLSFFPVPSVLVCVVMAQKQRKSFENAGAPLQALAGGPSQRALAVRR